MLDKRAHILLKTLIERYFAVGQPVGSRSLSRHAGLDLSPAHEMDAKAVAPELEPLRTINESCVTYNAAFILVYGLLLVTCLVLVIVRRPGRATPTA